MEQFYLGIDVAKNTLDCALLLPNGKLRHKSKLSNNSKGFAALTQWIHSQKAKKIHVCMEATGIYWEAVAQYLADAGHVVSVVNPFQIKSFAGACLQRGKTDKLDAGLIALFCAKQCPEPWKALSPDKQVLRAFVLRLDALQTMRVQELNRFQVARDVVRDSIAAHIQWLDEQIEALKKEIGQHINKNPDLKDKHELLDSVPGIGEHTSAFLLAFGIHPERFGNAREASAFAGIEPRLHNSGTSIRGKPRMSKRGHAILRKALYMPAMVTLYNTRWGKQFRQRLAAAGKPPMLIIGAMMRKLIHVAFGVLKSGKPFNPALHGA